MEPEKSAKITPKKKVKNKGWGHVMDDEPSQPVDP